MEQQAPFRAVAAAHLRHAVVLVRSSAGTIREPFMADLLRNGPDIQQQNVIYALDQRPRTGDLLAAYPGRTVYAWVNGRLSPLREAPAPAPRP